MKDGVRQEKDGAEAELIQSYEDELTWRLEELREDASVTFWVFF